MSADSLDRALETPAWFTHPVQTAQRKLIVEIERLEMPWHWERWEYPAADGTTVVYGVIYADVGYLPGAAPEGCVPVHTRSDVQYAWALYVGAGVDRRVHREEPVQLALFGAVA